MNSAWLVMCGSGMDDLPMGAFESQQLAADFCELCVKSGEYFARQFDRANDAVGYNASTPVCVYILECKYGGVSIGEFKRLKSYEIPDKEPWVRPFGG